jgi:hypothetical protein
MIIGLNYSMNSTSFILDCKYVIGLFICVTRTEKDAPHFIDSVAEGDYIDGGADGCIVSKPGYISRLTGGGTKTGVSSTMATG